MAKVYGGEIVAKVLKQFNVDTVFAEVSGHLDAVYLACDKAGIKFQDARSEYAVGFEALGYAKTSGKPGVAMVAPGGGIMNITNAIGSAYTDCLPLVVIAGQNPLGDYDGLTINALGDGITTGIRVMRPITKWAVQVPDITRLADLLGMALRRATEGRPGPVYIEISNPITWQEIDEEKVRYLKPVKAIRPAPTKEAVEHVIETLNNAKNPVVLVGGGVGFNPSYSPYLQEFVERFNLPFMTSHMSRGIISTKHRLYGKSWSTIAAMNHKGYEPDVILMIGGRIGLYAGGYRGCFFPKDAYFIQVDIEPEEFGRIRDADYPIVADAKEMLKCLLEATEGRTDLKDFQEWADVVTGIALASKQKARALLEVEGSEGVNSGDLAAIVSQNVPDDIVLAFGGGEATSWSDGVMDTTIPGSTAHHGYEGNIGEGTPQAIGAAIANPGRPVILMTSDGDIGYTFAEFETMTRCKIPVCAIVFNNSTWGMCSHSQDMLYDGKYRIISDFAPNVRYDLAAAAFGAHGEYVTKRDEIVPALQRSLEALKNGQPALINVITDDHAFHPMVGRNVSQKAFTKNEEGKVFTPWSEDFYA